MPKPPRLPPSWVNPDFTAGIRGSPVPQLPCGLGRGAFSQCPLTKPAPPLLEPPPWRSSRPQAGPPMPPAWVPPSAPSAPRTCTQSCSVLAAPSLRDLETGLAGLSFVPMPHLGERVFATCVLGLKGGHPAHSPPRLEPRPSGTAWPRRPPRPPRKTLCEPRPRRPGPQALPFARGVTPKPFHPLQNGSRVGPFWSWSSFVPPHSPPPRGDIGLPSATPPLSPSPSRAPPSAPTFKTPSLNFAHVVF